tara:strand:- start:916 stop:1020 length:105 start_codon:yes stop_codon:yes gene_type:complete
MEMDDGMTSFLQEFDEMKLYLKIALSKLGVENEL